MAKLSFKIEKIFCEECSLAVRRFIGHMDGVESIEVEDGGIAFDPKKITEKELARLTSDGIEKLGYKVEREGGERWRD